jgi:hypothetical protein
VKQVLLMEIDIIVAQEDTEGGGIN